MNYEKKWIVITGASMGIGAVYAEEFAKKKANLILTARTKEKLNSLADTLRKAHSIEVDVLPFDLAEKDSSHRLFGEIKKSGRPIFGLINNAGFGSFGKFHETPLDKIESMLMLNNYTLTSLTHLFLPGLLKQREGFIVNLASIVAYMPCPYMAVYAASKAYVLSLTTALWAEYRDSGVRILAVSPGATDTNFFARVGSDDLRKSAGSLDRPEDVVRETFAALEGSGSVVVTGSARNVVLTKMASLLPRQLTAKLFARSQEKSS